MAGPTRYRFHCHLSFLDFHRRAPPSSFQSEVNPSSTLTVPEDPDGFDKPSDYLSAVSIALMGCQLIASQFHIPGVATVFDTAIRMINALRDARVNVKESRRLVKITSVYSNLLMGHAISLSPMSDERIRQLEGHITNFVRILSKVDDVASRMNTRHVLAGVFSASSDKDELQQLEQRLNDALGIFRTEVLCHIDANVLGVHERLDRVEARIEDLIDAVHTSQQCPCSDCLAAFYSADLYSVYGQPTFKYG